MLAFQSKPFDSDDYIFEIKYDGTRAICYYEDGNVKLINRRDVDITYRYPEIVEAIKKCVRGNVVLDGEIVFLENGKPNFYKLAEREHIIDKMRIEILSKIMPATYIIFDILYLNGSELINLPLIERKKILREVVSDCERVKVIDYVIGKGRELFEFAKSNGYEGIMAKKINSAYEERRSESWLKIKVFDTLDVVVVGYTKGNGEREDFGSLLVATHINGKLKLIGSVGSGFDKKQIAEALEKLKNDIIPNPPPNLEIDELPNREIVWVVPKYVCEVKYYEITKNYQLRNPVFVRWRDDKCLF